MNHFENGRQRAIAQINNTPNIQKIKGVGYKVRRVKGNGYNGFGGVAPPGEEIQGLFGMTEQEVWDKMIKNWDIIWTHHGSSK